MKWQVELDKILRENFAEIKKKNANFSMRAFAKKLSLSPTALSQLLRSERKWDLSVERAVEIIEKIEMSSSQKDLLFNLMGLKNKRERGALPAEDHPFLLDDLVPAVLSSHDLAVNERSAENIAKRFGVKTERVRETVKLLLEKGYLERIPGNDALQRKQNFFAAGDGPPSQVVRQHHKNNFDLAKKAIEAVPPTDRDFTSLTFAANREQLALVQKEIREFHERIMSLMNREPQNNEVFRFSVSLFPIRSYLGEK